MLSSLNQVFQRMKHTLVVLLEHYERQSFCPALADLKKKLFVRFSREKNVHIQSKDCKPGCLKNVCSSCTFKEASCAICFENFDALFSAAMVEGSEASDSVTFFLPLNELVNFVN